MDTLLLTKLPNIVKVLAEKHIEMGITNEFELTESGCENAIIKIYMLNENKTCINMLYVIEGAIQRIRWHGLSAERKQELKEFYKLVD